MFIVQYRERDGKHDLVLYLDFHFKKFIEIIDTYVYIRVLFNLKLCNVDVK